MHDSAAEASPLIWGFTGHRVQRLGDFLDYEYKILPRLVDLCKKVIEEQEIKYAISGMALGFDTAVAEACVKLGVPFMAAVPGHWFHKRWQLKQVERYCELLTEADDVNFIDELNEYQVLGPDGEPMAKYDARKLHKRNEFIVDHSQKLIALWDGQREGGTYNCLQYAHSKGKEELNLWERWNRHKGF